MRKVMILILVFFTIACNGEKKEISGISDSKIPFMIGSQFKYLQIESVKAKETADKYFGKTSYKVIFTFKIQGEKAYFAVEEYMPDKIYNAIKRGIIVQSDGRIRDVFDTDIGIYNQMTGERSVDFKKIGIPKGEVSCFVFGYKDNRDNINNHLNIYIRLLDKNFNNIFDPNHSDARSSSLFEIENSVSLEKKNAPDKKSLFYLLFFDEKEEDYYNEIIKFYNKYKEGKTKGKVVKSMAVKAEFERIKKEEGQK